MAKDPKLLVYFTEAEKEALEEAAWKARKRFSEYVREATREKIEREKDQ